MAGQGCRLAGLRGCRVQVVPALGFGLGLELELGLGLDGAVPTKALELGVIISLIAYNLLLTTYYLLLTAYCLLLTRALSVIISPTVCVGHRKSSRPVRCAITRLGQSVRQHTRPTRPKSHGIGIARSLGTWHGVRQVAIGKWPLVIARYW